VDYQQNSYSHSRTFLLKKFVIEQVYGEEMVWRGRG